jgi:membrane protease YdiL (CAAX protease family)
MTTEPAPPDPYPAVPMPPAAPASAEDEARADVGPDGRRRPRWAPWTSVVALIAGLAAALFGALVIGALALAFGADFKHQPPSVTIAATVVQDLCLIGAAILFARFTGRVSPGDFGLRPTRLLPAIGWAVLAWASFYVFTAVFIAIIGANPNDDQLPKELGADESTLALLAVAFLVTVVAPVAEEFFFRGYFYGSLRNWRGMWPAAIGTGIVFGAIHGSSADPAFLLPLAFFGFSLCLLYEKTGSLYPGIAVHCANNTIAFGATQHWTWQIPVLLVCALSVIACVALGVRHVWSSDPPAAAPAAAA